MTQILVRNSILVCFGLILGAAASAQEAGFKPLFNGRDLTGWEGNAKLWSVKDGAITGQTSATDPIKVNTFLVYTAEPVDDFELRLSYRIVGGNSGIQYRSKVTDQAQWRVGGYQADFEAGKTYSGILYDEGAVAGGRGIMAERGQKVTWDKDCKKQVTGSLGKSEDIQAKIKNEDWNDYVITAQGNHLVHQINGVTTVDVTDECESKRLTSGVLALQIHVGPPMTVQFKNIRLKKLAGAAPRSDLDQLQGDWTLAELVANGETVPADALAGVKLKIKGNEYHVERSDGQDQGTFKLNASTNPKSMDVSAESGAELPAIYDVSGDTFKACYAVNGAARPAEFKSTPGSDHVLAVYKRKSQ
ncbi:MAG: DUF1080 domain-containing protein [Verrucomicrobia bacterium]|nr:DUF1080 domain-containing protein [Verrucomicrobiota bacterium]